MNEQANLDLAGIKSALVEALGQRSRKARFVTEVSATLRRFKIGKDELERALSELQAEAVVVVRDNFCADPHLANVDLRLATLMDDSNGGDAQVVALKKIDLAWNSWLGEYLANHRCG